MGTFTNLTGRRFGRLLAVVRVRNLTRSNRRAYWRCICDCGQSRIVLGVRLTQGNVRSCGCLRRDVTTAANIARQTTHGHRRLTASRTYRSWQAMFQRCTNPNHTYHKHYCDVRITERWRSFAAFLEDMGERPASTTLDRWPDPAGNYE